MASKIVIAVLHCNRNEPVKIIDLGVRLRDVGIYVNTTEYSSPVIAPLAFTTQLDKAVAAQGVVKGGGVNATVTRDFEVGALFDMESDKLLPYVNGLYKNNKIKLQLSGFYTSDDPSPHPVPEPVSIKEIIKWNTSTVARVKLARISNPLNTKKERYTYFVYISDDAEGTNQKLVLKATNRYKLILTNLELNKAIYVCVSRSNAAGESEVSGRIKYVAY